jgi:hypothetical protein
MRRSGERKCVKSMKNVRTHLHNTTQTIDYLAHNTYKLFVAATEKIKKSAIFWDITPSGLLKVSFYFHPHDFFP